MWLGTLQELLLTWMTEEVVTGRLILFLQKKHSFQLQPFRRNEMQPKNFQIRQEWYESLAWLWIKTSVTADTVPNTASYCILAVQKAKRQILQTTAETLDKIVNHWTTVHSPAGIQVTRIQGTKCLEVDLKIFIIRDESRKSETTSSGANQESHSSNYCCRGGFPDW